LPRLFRDVKIASIGPVTTKAITDAGLKVHIRAKKQSSAGVAEAIVSYYREKKAGTGTDTETLF